MLGTWNLGFGFPTNLGPLNPCCSCPTPGVSVVIAAMKILLPRFFALLAFLLTTHTTLATIAIIDQQNPVGTNTTGPGVGSGQSFTPTLPALDVVDVSISTVGPGVITTLHLDLFSGTGFNGTLVGSSDSITFSDFGFHPREFLFPTPIVLVPGNVYTFRITGGGYEESFSLGDLYAGGDEVTPNGIYSTEPVPRRHH
jgi:hypothetical protein